MEAKVKRRKRVPEDTRITSASVADTVRASTAANQFLR
jgi:hypothetical protein